VHVFNIIIGASYLFVDTFVTIAQIRNRYVSKLLINGKISASGKMTSMNKLTLMHHILGA
jgi:hypothetical protein